MAQRDNPLWEGSCAYAVKVADGYEIIVFSTNCVRHVVASVAATGDRAESVTRRLNSYPKQTRYSVGLL